MPSRQDTGAKTKKGGIARVQTKSRGIQIQNLRKRKKDKTPQDMMMMIPNARPSHGPSQCELSPCKQQQKNLRLFSIRIPSHANDVLYARPAPVPNDAMHAPSQNKEKKNKKKAKHADRRRQSRRAEPVEAGSQEGRGIIKKRR